jgi:hypothetical protein
MTRETTDTDTAEQVIDSFRILAGDKVSFMHIYSYHVNCKVSRLMVFANNTAVAKISLTV